MSNYISKLVSACWIPWDIVDSNEFGTRPGRKYLMDPLVISRLPKTYECTAVLICLSSGLTPRLLFTLVFFMSPHLSVGPTSRIKFTNTYVEYKTVGYSSEMASVENLWSNQSGHVRHAAGIVARRRLTSIVSANYRLATGSANENADAIVPLFWLADPVICYDKRTLMITYKFCSAKYYLQ